MKTTVIWVAFALACAAQLFVPANMILSREAVLKKGEAFHFKMQPYDPVDPFRGNYLQLSFEANMVAVDSGLWNTGDKAFAILTVDSAGFAKVAELSTSQPSPGVPYVIATVSYTTPFEAVLIYPFERYYIESKLAPAAEDAVRKAMIDSSAVAYAKVFVREDLSVLRSLHINGKSLEEVMKEGEVEIK